MPRPRIYDDTAEKQKAYRERHLAGTRNKELGEEAKRLHDRIGRAVQTGTLPADLLGTTPLETLQKVGNHVLPANTP